MIFFNAQVEAIEVLRIYMKDQFAHISTDEQADQAINALSHVELLEKLHWAFVFDRDTQGIKRAKSS